MKRPLVWMTGSFLMGMLLCYFTNEILPKELEKGIILKSKTIVEILLLVLLLLWFSFIILYKRKSKAYEIGIMPTSYYYIISFSFPILFFTGYFRLQDTYSKPTIDGIFTDKLDVSVKGHIDSIENRKEYQVVYIKNTTVMLEDSYDTYKVLSIRATILEGTYRIGQEVIATGTLSKFTKASNLGQFDEYSYYKRKGVDYKLKIDAIQLVTSDYNPYKDILNQYKNKLREFYLSVLPESEGGIMSAMILGESYLLEEDIKLLYNQNGISHILAISGLHISLIGSTLYYILHRMKCHKLVITCISIGLMLSYGIMTNFSVSTNRAIVMFICLVLGKLIGRTYDTLSATSLSCLIILIQSPLQIVNAGFLLSFAAILAIAIIVPVLQKIFPIEYKAEQKKKYSIRSIYVSILNSLMVSGAVYVMILPITLYYFYEVPLYSILINILILPLSSILLILGLISGMVGCVSILGGNILIGAAYYILKIYEFICELGIRLPCSMILVGKPMIEMVIIYYVMLGIFLRIQWMWKAEENMETSDNNSRLIKEHSVNKNSEAKLKMNPIEKLHIKKLHMKKSFLLLPCLLLIFYHPRDNLEVSFLDVGQGDSIYINYENKLIILVDGGSSSVSQLGKYRITPFLKAKGVSELDYVVLTHYDQDHISGIMEILKQLEKQKELREYSLGYKGVIGIKTLVLPKYEFEDSSKNEVILNIHLLAKKIGIKLITMDIGDSITLDELKISCIYPSSKDNISSSNNTSTVLSLTYKEFDLLLTGDIEASGESELIHRIKYQYDVLKVAHHGSKGSSTMDFIQKVNPRISIISAGKNNTYGHPHSEVLDRLAKVQSEKYITYESGAITIKTDGSRMVVEQFNK